jgi:protein-tyrosine phosphatase
MKLLDADKIYGPIYQGSKPPYGRAVAASGFGVLVLSAKEYQPASIHFPGVHVVYAPFDDGDLTKEEFAVATKASKVVSEAASDGIPVLITCYQGRNRSGLISALAVYRLTGESGVKIAHLIKSKRRGALTNPDFLEMVRRLPARR